MSYLYIYFFLVNREIFNTPSPSPLKKFHLIRYNDTFYLYVLLLSVKFNFFHKSRESVRVWKLSQTPKTSLFQKNFPSCEILSTKTTKIPSCQMINSEEIKILVQYLSKVLSGLWKLFHTPTIPLVQNNFLSCEKSQHQNDQEIRRWQMIIMENENLCWICYCSVESMRVLKINTRRPPLIQNNFSSCEKSRYQNDQKYPVTKW